jgi:outer membrane receptor protein involved in Fe transport
MHPPKSHRKLLSAGTLALLASVAARPMPAHAQTAVTGHAPAAAHPEDPVILQEVIVTANRREQSVLDVPYNITAATSAQLENAGVTDFSGLTQLVPGLVYNGGGIRLGGSQNGFIMRGLNSSRTSTTDQPSLTVAPVSLYIDDTPMFANVHLADVNRVEVLRGPQGTLYGNGSVGGTLRVIYNEPDPTGFATRVQAESSQTDHAGGPNYSADGMINIPLASTLALRVSAGHVFDHGFVDGKNLFVRDSSGAPLLATPDDPIFSLPLTHVVKDLDDAQLTYARAALKYDTGPFKVTFAYLHQEESADGQPGDTRGVGTVPSAFSSAVTPGFLNDGFDAAIPPNYREAESGVFVREPYRRRIDLESLEASYDFGFATLTSSTSYYDNGSRAVSDISGSYQKNLGVFYFGFPRLTVESVRSTSERTFAQELRLVSKSGATFEWVAGLFYQDLQHRFANTDWMYGWSTFVEATTGLPFPEERAFDYTRDLKFQDKAAFGELTWHVTSRWQMTGGVRAYDQELKIATLTKLPICGAFCSNSGVDPEGTTQGQDRRDDSDVLTKLNTSYSLSDNLVGYFTFAEGTRRGGANAVPTSGQFAQDPAFVTFDPDSVKSYEVGLKGTLAGTWDFSTSLYWTQWHKPILDIVTPLGGFFAAINGDEARTRGVELALDGRVTDTLSVSAGYAYTEAELTSAFTVGGFSFGAEGERLPGVPRHQVTLGADYLRPIGAGSTLIAHVDGAFRGEVNTALTGSLGATSVEDYWMWNANFGFAHDAYRVTLFVDNIANTRGLTTRLPPEAVDQRHAVNWLSRPRTIGLRLAYSF